MQEGVRESVTNFFFHGMINGGKNLVGREEPQSAEIIDAGCDQDENSGRRKNT